MFKRTSHVQDILHFTVVKLSTKHIFLQMQTDSKLLLKNKGTQKLYGENFGNHQTKA